METIFNDTVSFWNLLSLSTVTDTLNDWMRMRQCFILCVCVWVGVGGLIMGQPYYDYNAQMGAKLQLTRNTALKAEFSLKSLPI